MGGSGTRPHRLEPRVCSSLQREGEVFFPPTPSLPGVSMSLTYLVEVETDPAAQCCARLGHGFMLSVCCMHVGLASIPSSEKAMGALGMVHQALFQSLRHNL